MTNAEFDGLLMGCIKNANAFYLILQEKDGVPDFTDWYAVEFDNGERYSFVRVGDGCTGTFSLYDSYIDKAEVSCEFFDEFYQQIKSISQGQGVPTELIM